MSTPDPTLLIVAAYSATVVFVALVFFHRYDTMRPPLGTMNMRDIIFALGAIAILPYVYLALPVWAVALVIGALWFSLLAVFLGPLIPSRTGRWIAAGSLICADVVALEWLGPDSVAFHLVNNTAVVLVAAAVANLWAQGGLRARELCILAAGLMVYDPIATSHLTLMTDLMTRFRSAPLQPSIAWGTGNHMLGIGFGDITLAALLSLVLIKSFGTRLAVVGAATLATVIFFALWGFQSNAFHLRAFPAMLIIGPVILGFCTVGVTRKGRERTTFEYRTGRAPLRSLQESSHTYDVRGV